MTIVALALAGGHLQRMLPLIAGLSRRGSRVHVLTTAEARPAVENAGGQYHDFFARFPLDGADAQSIPQPSRYVTFAAAFFEPMLAEIAALGPSLVVYDPFVVVAPLLARRLGIPYVSLRPGHAQVPARAVAAIRRDPRVATSDACLAAVERLRREHGIADAHPFLYLEGLSPHLNLYSEPEVYLSEEDRRALEPLAFFGSVAPDLREAESRERPFAGRADRLRIYVAFGGIIWRYFTEAAYTVMASIADALPADEACVLVGAGGHVVPAETRRQLEREHVRIEDWADQWGALKDADLFVTHHGLNSTHESIYHRVPMLSYPFFADQPALAHRCQELGLALAFGPTLLAPLDAGAARRAVDTVRERRAAFDARLAEAHAWELDVIAARDSVLDRVLALAR